MSDPELAADVSSQEAHEIGRSLRSKVGRRSHAAFTRMERDPVAILEDQHATRLQGLVPVRIARMLESPFAYYRGTAAVMAHDLAAEAVTGHHLVICGDAHIANFGLFASPERRVLFDLNDFDESTVGPWEWDVKRLAASIHVGARDKGLDEATARDASQAAVRSYREWLQQMCAMSVVERHFFQLETDWLEQNLGEEGRKVLHRTVRKATRRTSAQVLEKITTVTDCGQTRIVDQPPLMVHAFHATDDDMALLMDRYISTVRADAALLLSQFRLVDVVMRVVGVGSVGTRCYVLLLQGPAGEPLFLQAKEAQPSVIHTYGRVRPRLPAGISPPASGPEGHRVVVSQRILQAQSDPFLGWIAGYRGESAERIPTDYYWRQFRDMKGSVELDRLSSAGFSGYGELCAKLLARAHSQSPAAAVVDGYLGSSEKFDEAVSRWAAAYADQVEADFEAVERATRTGRLPVDRGS